MIIPTIILIITSLTIIDVQCQDAESTQPWVGNKPGQLYLPPPGQRLNMPAPRLNLPSPGQGLYIPPPRLNLPSPGQRLGIPAPRNRWTPTDANTDDDGDNDDDMNADMRSASQMKGASNPTRVEKQTQTRPKPQKKMTPRSAMTSYCSDSDPKLMEYVSCTRNAMMPQFPNCYKQNAGKEWPTQSEVQWSYYCDRTNRRLVRRTERCVRKASSNRREYAAKLKMCLDILNEPKMTPVDNPTDAESDAGRTPESIGDSGNDDGSSDNAPQDGGTSAMVDGKSSGQMVDGDDCE